MMLFSIVGVFFRFDKVADQRSLALIRELEDQAPIDPEVGRAITSLWKGESFRSASVWGRVG